MRNKKLTDKFWLREFYRNGKIPDTIPAETMYLIQCMANTLQTIRTFLGGHKIYITSGVREASDYMRLIRAGYNPSPKSDHFYGIAVPTRRKKDIAKYGKYYSRSVGATDFICEGPGTLAEKYIKLVNGINGNLIPINPRQLIFEKTESGLEWIHISNDALVLNSEKFISDFDGYKTQFLCTKNGGKNYRVFDPRKIPAFMK